MTALHLGRLRPGDRVLSVRRLSDLTGMNPKTVHRAYRALADEGLLEVRPGSGTFVAESGGGDGALPATRKLLTAVNHCRAQAAALGLGPETFAAFLHNYHGRCPAHTPLAVVECNHEQIGLIGRALSVALGIAPRPVLLADLAKGPRRTLDGTIGVVTTDCHRIEVADLVAPLGVPMYRVAFDPGFPRQMARYAEWGPVIMVVRDGRFAPVFLRLLRQMAVPRDLVARFVIVEPEQARRALREVDGNAALHVSPLVDREQLGPIPVGLRRIELSWRLAAGTLERVRSRIALDLALGASRHAQHQSP